MSKQTFQKRVLKYLEQDHVEFDKVCLTYITITYIWKTQFKIKDFETGENKAS